MVKIKSPEAKRQQANELIQQAEWAERAAVEEFEHAASEARSPPKIEFEPTSIPPEWELPDGEGLKLPPKYIASIDGDWPIFHLSKGSDGKTRRDLAAPCPMAITAQIQTLDKETFIQLKWRAKGRPWAEILVSLECISSGKLIVSLAKYKIPITDGNKDAVLRYLTAFFHCNEQVIPYTHAVRQYGWVDDNPAKGFVLGKHHWAKQGAAPVKMFGELDGASQWVSAFRDGEYPYPWYAAIDCVKQWPVVEIAIYAALAPVLLRILDAPNFLIDFSGRTSTGKTALLTIAASVWGKPDPQAQDTLIQTWDSTPVGIERNAEILSCLPIFLDESKRLNTKEADNFVYMLYDGRGRIRGNKTGVDQRRRWRTVVLSTGEYPLTDIARGSGAKARVLTIQSPPFGKDIEAIGPLMRAIKKDGWGSAGPCFVKSLIKMTEGDRGHQFFAKLKTEFDALEQVYLTELQQTPGELYRMGRYLAVLSMTCALARKIFGVQQCDAEDTPLPRLIWTHDDPIRSFLLPHLLDKEEGFETRADESLKMVQSYIGSNPLRIFRKWNSEQIYESSPTQGWLAVQFDEGGDLFFFREELYALLEKRGGYHMAELKNWRDQKWLACNNGLCFRHAFEGQIHNFVRVRAEHLRAPSLEGVRESGPSSLSDLSQKEIA